MGPGNDGKGLLLFNGETVRTNFFWVSVLVFSEVFNTSLHSHFNVLHRKQSTHNKTPS